MDASVSIPRNVVSSIVHLRVDIPSEHPSAGVLGQERHGSGVVVGPGRVLTAHYLVLGATRVDVTRIDGRSDVAERIAIDHDSGLALLSVPDAGLRAVQPTPHTLSPGTPVFLLCATSETSRRGTTGFVITAGPFEAFWEYMLDRALVTTAINPGLAGAALFDVHGRLGGIIALGLAAVGRHSLAIPVDLFVSRQDDLETKGEARDWPPHAWVGIFPQGLEGGVSVTGVVAAGPADNAGIARGDMIVSVDGLSVRTLRELYSALWRKGPGERIDLQILRDSAIRIVEIIAGDRYDFYR